MGAPIHIGEDMERVHTLPIREAEAAAESAGVPLYMARLNIFRVLLRHPELARALHDLLATLLWKGSLDKRMRELVIMRLGWVTGSVYEWTQHWSIAGSIGVSEQDLLGVREWRAYPGFGPRERALMAAVDEVVRDGSISPDTWAQIVEHVTPAAADESGDKTVLEVVAVIGAWRMVSTWLQSLGVPLEDGVEPWPPDGVAPGE